MSRHLASTFQYLHDVIADVIVRKHSWQAVPVFEEIMTRIQDSASEQWRPLREQRRPLRARWKQLKVPIHLNCLMLPQRVLEMRRQPRRTP